MGGMSNVDWDDVLEQVRKAYTESGVRGAFLVLDQYDEPEDKVEGVWREIIRARIRIAQGEYPAALAILDAQHQHLNRQEHPVRYGRVLMLEGIVHSWLGDPAIASVYLKEAVEIARGSGDTDTVRRALRTVADLACEEHKFQEALDLMEGQPGAEEAFLRARALAGLGRLSLALDVANESLLEPHIPHQNRINLQVLRAWICCEGGYARGGMEALEGLTNNDDPLVEYCRGHCDLLAGKRLEGGEHWNRFLDDAVKGKAVENASMVRLDLANLAASDGDIVQMRHFLKSYREARAWAGISHLVPYSVILEGISDLERGGDLRTDGILAAINEAVDFGTLVASARLAAMKGAPPVIRIALERRLLERAKEYVPLEGGPTFENHRRVKRIREILSE